MSRTIIGHVSRLRAGVSAAGGHAIHTLCFDCTVNRTPLPAKVFRVCGEVWGAEQSILAGRIREGGQVVVVGCVKRPDSAAMVQLPRLDLERLAKVA